MHVLRRVLIVSPHSHQILFHRSFSEWFLDVKYCTQTYLCQAGEGHMTKAIALGSHGPSLSPSEIADLAYRLLNSSKFFSDPQLIPISPWVKLLPRIQTILHCSVLQPKRHPIKTQVLK
jgi:hypothetical protein